MRALSLGRSFDGILAWDSFFHLKPDDQRQMFAVFPAHAGGAALLMFNAGPAHGEGIGSYREIRCITTPPSGCSGWPCQPLDLLPPVDVTSATTRWPYAVAHQIANPVDPRGYLDILLKVFRNREILDAGGREDC